MQKTWFYKHAFLRIEMQELAMQVRILPFNYALGPIKSREKGQALVGIVERYLS